MKLLNMTFDAWDAGHSGVHDPVVSAHRAGVIPGETTVTRQHAKPSQGAFASLLLKLMARPARVTEVTRISEHFRLITLSGPALKGVQWKAGQEIQLLSRGLVPHSYTPLYWDAAEGLTAILAYSHGHAPGSGWAAELRVGDACQIVGPRGPLDLETIRRPALFIGDETSFGLAHALYETGMAMRDVEFLFEVSSVAESEQVLQELVIRDAKLIQRSAGDAHLAAAEAHIAERLASGKHFAQYLLSGNASSVGRLSHTLKQRGVTAAKITTKVYWAADRAGPD